MRPTLTLLEVRQGQNDAAEVWLVVDASGAAAAGADLMVHPRCALLVMCSAGLLRLRLAICSAGLILVGLLPGLVIYSAGLVLGGLLLGLATCFVGWPAVWTGLVALWSDAVVAALMVPEAEVVAFAVAVVGASSTAFPGTGGSRCGVFPHSWDTLRWLPPWLCVRRCTPPWGEAGCTPRI